MTLRPLAAADLRAVMEAGNFPEVARGTFVPHPLGRSDARAYIERLSQGGKLGHVLALLITDRDSSRVLGIAGLSNFRPKDPAAELFYWLTPPAWGRGYATEAARALLRVAFVDLQLHRLTAHVLAYNAPSVRVLRRLGFRPEGRSREVRKDHEGWQDELHFGLLEGEYRRGGGSGSGSRGSRRPAPRSRRPTSSSRTVTRGHKAI